MKLNKFILAIFLLAPLTLNATSLVLNPGYEAQRCRELWLQFENFIKQEHVPVCKSKMKEAAHYIGNAIDDLWDEKNVVAKPKLKMAIDVLASTSVESCDLAEELSHFKIDFEKIYDLI